MKFAAPASRFFLLTLAASLLACGGSAPKANVAVENNSSAGVAAKASEPRTTDPTGAKPATNLPESNGGVGTGQAPAKFGNVGMTGAEPEPASGPAPMKAVPSKIGARHVLIQWMGAEKATSSVVRSKEQAYNVAKEVHRRAKAKDDFARLAVEYSDEPNAGQRGGSVGRFGHGQMVPEFEQAAFKLDVGQVSEIVESPFGFHVIQRTE